MTYATDGKCHNAEPGTFNHECGRPAEWIGTNANGFRSGFCLRCRAQGSEARGMVKWEPAKPPLPASAVDVSTVTEYGLTQKLSNPIRCF